jgi:hypothetical protein
MVRKEEYTSLACHMYMMKINLYTSFPWCKSSGKKIPKCYTFFISLFDPIPGNGLPLQGFAITQTGHTTLGMTPLDE